MHEHGINSDTIRRVVVPIRGYDELKRRQLRGQLERYARSLRWIDARPGGSLLDLGASGDLVPAYQALLGYDRVVCLHNGAAAGRQRLVHQDGSTFQFDLQVIDLERAPFPFPDASFDQVVAMEVLEHLAADPMFMLAEANRVLKPGGSLLLTTPNITSLASVYLQLIGRHPAIGRQTYGPGIADRHNREYTPQEVTEVVAAAGFRLQRLDTFDTSPPNSSLRRTARMLRILHRFKPGIGVHSRGSVIRCAAVRTGAVAERFPEVIYPRYAYYDYAAYDEELGRRFGGRRYWSTNVRLSGGPPDLVAVAHAAEGLAESGPA